ncbi:MAG: MopE-related protein, partial [bacterium]
FVNPSIGDFHLQNCSPCINTGTDVEAPDEDKEGNLRPSGGGYDMGAYEFPGNPLATYYEDSDYDGFGDPNISLISCSMPVGYINNMYDCNDDDPNINPTAFEICDHKDNNCNGLLDEGFDNDIDGYTTCGGDCNDDDPNIHVGAIEKCNGKDDDCDSEIDEEDSQGCNIYYKDEDEDGYGAEGDSRCLCAQEGYYTVSEGGDPDDLDPNNPSPIIDYKMDLHAGWSLISLPIEPLDTTVDTLFPGAHAVFRFTTIYERLDRNDHMLRGEGYWIFMPENRTYTITGLPFSGYTLTNVQTGWSMIGGCTFSALPSITNGTIRAIYGFSDEYIPLDPGDPLEPGQGYWINLSHQTTLMVGTE